MSIASIAKLCNKGFGKYKPQIAVLLLLGFFSAFLEGVGISTLIPLFSRFTEGTATDDPTSQILGRVLQLFGLGFAFKALLIIIVFAFILKSIFLFISYYISARITADYERDSRSGLFKGLLEAHWPFLTRQKIGYLETILIKDLTEVRVLLGFFAQASVALTSLIVYVAIALTISPTITLLSLVLGGAMFLVLKPLLYRIKALSKQQAEALSGMSHFVGEGVLGIKNIKAGSVIDAIAREADQYFFVLRQVNIKLKIFHQIPTLLSQPMSVFFVVSIFAFLYTTENFELGIFIASMYLVYKIFTYIHSLQAIVYSVAEKIPYLERVIEFSEGVFRNKEQYGGKEAFQFEESIEFKNVRFFYTQERAVLSNINVFIRRGEMVGLVGRSGSGKTTIADLLLRLMQPSWGNITADGVDITQININEWRKNIAYVSQDTFITNDTIFNNVKFYDESICDDDVFRAIKQAYMYDFVQSLPNGLKTEAGERGILFSGGEKQRLALARALARNSKILVLDEATSALDNESELMIQGAIEKLKGKMTIIVIAHRLSTLFNCDKVIFLEKGRIKEEGPPQKLLADKNSSFYKLYNIKEGANSK